MLGRRGPAQAAFTNKELKELGELPGVDVVVDPAGGGARPASAAEWAARNPNRTRDRNLEILRGFAGREPTGAPVRIHLHFLVSPVEIIGSERVEGLTIVHNELYESRGRLHPAPRHRPAHHPPAAGWCSGRSATRGCRSPGSPSTRCAA